MPQPGGAFLDDGARQLRHAGRRRALAGREREDVQMRQPAFLDDRERILEHRLGLGRKAGDDVGAEDDVGRILRMSAQKRIESSRLWRRFMRLRIMSSPCCSERCRCGISRVSAPIASSSSGSASIESMEDSRSRARSGTCLRIVATSRPSAGCRAGRRHSSSCRRRSAPLRHSRCRPAASPARRRRPSAPSANCRGRRG
jgi:hypothetical protein